MASRRAAHVSLGLRRGYVDGRRKQTANSVTSVLKHDGCDTRGQAAQSCPHFARTLCRKAAFTPLPDPHNIAFEVLLVPSLAPSQPPAQRPVLARSEARGSPRGLFGKTSPPGGRVHAPGSLPKRRTFVLPRWQRSLPLPVPTRTGRHDTKERRVVKIAFSRLVQVTLGIFQSDVRL